jgi:hypothetical protein
MKIFNLVYCEELLKMYLYDFGGQITQINEGVLGLGELLLHGAEGKKTVLIKERYLNNWASVHTIRMYNKTPKKYQKLIDNQ